MNIFDSWNIEKQNVDARDVSDVYFYEREVWFVKAGKNIGFEQDGTGEDFLRPALILRKLNKDIFVGVFLSTTKKRGKYYYEVNCAHKDGVVILSQIKLMSAKRLYTKLCKLPKRQVAGIKKAVSDILNDSFGH